MMLRKRLRIILYMAMAVVLGLGACIVWTTITFSREYDKLIDRELVSIRAAGEVVLHSNIAEQDLLRSSILGLESYPSSKPRIDQSLYQVGASIDRIRVNARTPEERIYADRMRSYASELKQFHDTRVLLDITDDDERILELSRLSGLVKELSSAAGATEKVNLNRISKQRDKFSTRIKSTIIYASGLTMLGMLILYALYALFSKLTVDPILEFTELVNGVKNRNFDLKIDTERSDELGKLFLAFNEMARELKLLTSQTDEEILKLNERNRVLLESFPNAVIVAGENGSIIQKNPPAEKILEELGDTDTLPSKLANILEQVHSSGEDYLHAELDDALLIRINDQEAYFLPRVFKLHEDGTDQQQLWGLMLSDVTHIRWLDDVKMNTLGTVSHEVKTPLTSIRMMLHLLLEQKTGSLSELQLEMVQSAYRECERMVGVLDHMLNVSKISSGSKNLKLVSVKPYQLFDNLPTSLIEEANKKSITIQIECSQDLPKVNADSERILQVVNNFLSNAIKYSPESSTVVMKAFKRGADHVRFKVIDEGQGVPPEAQEHIFEKFYRAEGQQVAGTGLGLSIARQIINAHEGNIGFKSPDGGPTIFYFELPIA